MHYVSILLITVKLFLAFYHHYHVLGISAARTSYRAWQTGDIPGPAGDQEDLVDEHPDQPHQHGHAWLWAGVVFYYYC